MIIGRMIMTTRKRLTNRQASNCWLKRGASGAEQAP